MSGSSDSAIYYSKVFARQFPAINIEGVLLEVKEDYENQPIVINDKSNKDNISTKTKICYLSEKIDLYRSHGVTRDTKKMINKEEGLWYYEQLLLGFNFRMSDIHAALGISQMNSLDKFISKRNELSQIYTEELKGLPLTIQRVRKEDLSAWHIFVIRLKLSELKLSRLEIYNSLRNKGIGVNVHYIPVHLHPFYKNLGFNKGDFPNSENYYDGAITIPMFTKLKKKEIKYVIQALKESID